MYQHGKMATAIFCEYSSFRFFLSCLPQKLAFTFIHSAETQRRTPVLCIKCLGFFYKCSIYVYSIYVTYELCISDRLVSPDDKDNSWRFAWYLSYFVQLAVYVRGTERFVSLSAPSSRAKTQTNKQSSDAAPPAIPAEDQLLRVPARKVALRPITKASSQP